MSLSVRVRRWLLLVVVVAALAAAAVARLLFAPSSPGTVVINEVMSSNGSVAADDDEDFEDWIELYNPTSAVISLAGYTLSDSPANPRRWVIPDVVVEPGEHLVVWASGKSYWYQPDRHPTEAIELGFLSGGTRDGDRVELLLAGDNVASTQTGLHLAVIDGAGALVDTDVFDPGDPAAESARLVATLEALPPHHVFMLAVKGDAASVVTGAGVEYLRETIGSRFAHRLDPDDSWGLIAVTGGNVLVEDYRVPGDGEAEGDTRSSRQLHTSFRLRRTGDFLGLYDPAGRPIDTVGLREMARNSSWGRHVDASTGWCHYAEPSPGGANMPFCTPMADIPATTLPGGFYREPIEVSLGNSRVSEIRYTLDGAEPTQGSTLYTEPIALESTTILRARKYRAGFNPSDAISRSYFIDEADVDVSLAVLSVITDPDNLWDPRTGIHAEGLDPDDANYEQRGRAWERPVTVEFYEANGDHEFSVNAGLRILGNTSREFPKKSFVLYFREHYGTDALRYQMFDTIDRDRFESLVLRMGGDDGVADLPRMRDASMHTLFREAGGYGSAARPVFLYLNGAPWGIYNLRERIDVDYLAEHFGQADVDFIREADDVRAGDLDHWNATLSFFEGANLDLAQDLARAHDLIDIENFIDYYLFQIYAGNIDLVEANLVKFRPRFDGGRWRWLLWDVDVSFGLASSSPVTHDTLAWFTRDGARPDLGFYNDDGADSLWATIILRRLVEATATRYDFLNRLADLLNTALSRDHVLETLDEHAELLDPDIPYDLEIWSDEWDGTVEGWLDEVEALREFARERPDVVRQLARDRFALTDAVLMVEGDDEMGSVRVNTLEIDRFPWTGLYFREVPVTLEAVPADGFEFAGWGDASWPQTPTVRVLPERRTTVRPLFR